MGITVPSRFEPIRLLRKDRVSSTFVATDRGLGRNEVVVKIFGKGAYAPDTETLVDIFSWYRGLRHVFFSDILDAGITPKRELYFVRAYHPRSEFFKSANASYLKSLVSAIDFLHSMNRVHGSIKPSNLFAAQDGVKITDPWIGQNRADAKWPLTEEDIRFSAPEVLSGGVVSVDGDLYSLGALLYRFFSGRDPFEDSDLESLKAKYIWAAPRSLASVAHVSKPIGEVVADLLNKDPGLRKAAFETLKEELGIVRQVATRAPAVGLSGPVAQTFKRLLVRPGLNMVLVEGPAGSGKSRFVEELHIYASLAGVSSLTCPTAQDPYLSLVRRAIFVAEEQSVGTASVSLVRLQDLAVRVHEPSSAAEHQELDRDLVGLLASVTRQRRVVLLIEDLHRGSRKLLGLIDLLIQQLNNFDLSLVVTAQSEVSSATKTLKKMADFLGEAFNSVKLDLLSGGDSRALASFLSNGSDQQATAVQKAGGNPLFLEECARNPTSPVPKRVRNTLSAVVSGLPRTARQVAESLSILGKSADWNLLRKVSGLPEVDLHTSVNHLEQLGLVSSDKFSIRYPYAQTILHSKIPKARRTDLHARSFQYLRELGTESEILADHAFHGCLFNNAASLYRLLGAGAFKAKDFRRAARYFSMVSDCRSRDPQVPPLEPSDSIKLAKSHAMQGNKSLAVKILRELLESKVIREDSDLLSSIYATFASPLVEDSPKNRIRLLELAIGCLKPHSKQLVLRYRELAVAYLSSGNLSESEKVLKEIEIRNGSQEDFRHLGDIRASIFMNRGRFKEAVLCLTSSQYPLSTPGGVSNNLAVCVEQLGDLKKARQLQTKALQEADNCGSLLIQVIARNNLASMETKLGNVREAKELFASSLGKLRSLERQSKKAHAHNFGMIYCDFAAYSLEKGEYRNASSYLARVNGDDSGPFPSELFLIRITKCHLCLELGQLRSARMVLESTNTLPLSEEFFEIERLLVASRLQEPTREACSQLESALAACDRLETLYLKSRVYIALGRMLLLLGEITAAKVAASEALCICGKKGYRILATRALLLFGIAAERDPEKTDALERSLKEAREMELSPIVAECLFRLGQWHISKGQYATGKELLSKSVSVATSLADGLSWAERKTYLERPDLSEARNLLHEASTKAASLPSNIEDTFLDKENAFFGKLYRLVAAMTAASDLQSAMSILHETLRQSLSHTVFVVSGLPAKAALHPVNGAVSEEMIRRVSAIAVASKDKPYITGVGTSRDTAIWIPILSLAMRGGIYIECLPGHSSLEEQEIEFLAIVGAIAGAAFDRVCAKIWLSDTSPATKFHGIVGSSKQILEVHAAIQIAGKNAASVLIEGDSGTGKELVARAIHVESARSKGPFIPVDCGALPEGLIEAELFGAKKGAYTGATMDRLGLFEAANNGTIFLDEISNLGLAAQAKLLRVLQEREVRKIGSMTGRAVDVRLIAATNCNLERLVRDGKFRQDLLYRLKVLHILLPALRDRKADIPVLATTFLEQLNVLNQTRKYFGARILEKFIEHDYPGNVRELQNAVERAFYSSSGAVITQLDFLRDANSVDLPETSEIEKWFRDLSEGRENFWSAVHDPYKRRDISRERVVALMDFGLRATRGNYKAMASMLQIPEKEYRRFMDFLRRSRCLLDFRPYRRGAEDQT